MALDIPDAHAARVHRNNLVVETRKAALVLGNQLRLKRAAAVTRNLKLNVAGVRDHRLLAVTVAKVTRRLAVRLRSRRLRVQMVVHLRVQHPFR
jgi:hypothetical protein